LAKALPVAISFLASLLGLGGLSDKIKKIIEAVQKPVGKAVDAIVKGALKLAGPVINAIKKGAGWGKGKVEAGKKWVKGKVEAGKKWVKAKAGKLFGKDKDKDPKQDPTAGPVTEWWKSTAAFADKTGHGHRVFFSGQGANARLKVASKEQFTDEFVSRVQEV